MAKGFGSALSGSLCPHCGQRRGSDHCPARQPGPPITAANHPSNNGDWERLASSIKGGKL